MSDSEAPSSRIRVAIRLRPFLPSQPNYTNTLLTLCNTHIQVHDKSFQFDHTFPETATQQQLFTNCEVERMIDRVLDGYHSTIFAYGQTGSGKTHTMQGEQMDGVIPRALKYMFGKVRESTGRSFTVSVSFLQIYNERIYDLLNSANPAQGLRLRWNKNQQFTVENLFVFECKTREEAEKFFMQGLKNRVVASHKLNLSSSRSHSIFTIKVESFDFRNPNSQLTSRLDLVDLAGSQRIGLTGTQGKMAKQAIDINKSLFTLRQVITTLSELHSPNSKPKPIPASNPNSTTLPLPHIPYRDSKLTSILKQSIGGNSYCLMIACISPNDSFLDENLSTLTYATKATMITNKPKKNADPRANIIEDLMKQVKELSGELGKANRHIEMMSEAKFKEKGGGVNVNGNGVGANLNGITGNQPKTLVESIHMVRELLKSNKQLRETLEIRNQMIEKRDFQIYDLEKENQRLRDQISQQMDYIAQLTKGDKKQQTSGYRSRMNGVRRRVETLNEQQPRPLILQLTPANYLANFQTSEKRMPQYSPLRHKTQTNGGFMRSTLRSYQSLKDTHNQPNYQPQPRFDDLPTHFSSQQAAKDQRQYQHSLQFRTMHAWRKAENPSSPSSSQSPQRNNINVHTMKKMSKTGMNFRRRSSQKVGTPGFFDQ